MELRVTYISLNVISILLSIVATSEKKCVSQIWREVEKFHKNQSQIYRKHSAWSMVVGLIYI